MSENAKWKAMAEGVCTGVKIRTGMRKQTKGFGPQFF